VQLLVHESYDIELQTVDNIFEVILYIIYYKDKIQICKSGNPESPRGTRSSRLCCDVSGFPESHGTPGGPTRSFGILREHGVPGDSGNSEFRVTPGTRSSG